MRGFNVIVFLLLFVRSHAQINVSGADTLQIQQLNKSAREEWLNGNLALAESLATKAVSFSQNINYTTGLANAYNHLGNIFNSREKQQLAIAYHRKAIKIRYQLKDLKGVSSSLYNLAIAYQNSGNYTLAISNAFASLRLKEKIDDQNGIASCYNVIGNVYGLSDNQEKSKEFYMKALQIHLKLNNLSGAAGMYSNISAVYFDQNNNDSAAYYAKLSIELHNKINNVRGAALSKVGLANVYYRLGQKDSARKLYEEVEEQEKILLDFAVLSQVKNNLAYLFQSAGDLKSAERLSREALRLSIEHGLPEQKKSAELSLSEITYDLGNFKESIDHHRRYVLLNDSLRNLETVKKIVQQQMLFDFEKKSALQKIEQEKKEALAKEMIQRRNLFIYVGVFFFVVTLLFSLYVYKGFLQKKRANELLNEKNRLIENKQKEILDSIAYARRIQNAIITSEYYIAKTLERVREK